MLHQRFGYRELVSLHDFREYLFVQQLLVLVIALLPQHLANFFL